MLSFEAKRVQGSEFSFVFPAEKIASFINPIRACWVELNNVQVKMNELNKTMFGSKDRSNEILETYESLKAQKKDINAEITKLYSDILPKFETILISQSQYPELEQEFAILQQNKPNISVEDPNAYETHDNYIAQLNKVLVKINTFHDDFKLQAREFLENLFRSFLDEHKAYAETGAIINTSVKFNIPLKNTINTLIKNIQRLRTEADQKQFK